MTTPLPGDPGEENPEPVDPPVDPPADPTDPPVDPPADPPAPPVTSNPTALDIANLRKALNSERAAHKAMQRALAAEKLAKEDERTKAIREAAESAAKLAVDKLTPAAAKAAARAELLAAGVQGDPKRFIGLLDLDNVEISDDGTIEGLADQVTALKTDYPELFTVAKPPKPAPGNANGGAGGASKDKQPPAPKGFAQQLADQVLTAGH